MGAATDEPSSDELAIDPLATQRARVRFEQLLTEASIPALREGDLFRFGFAQLCGRLEALAHTNANIAHLHLTMSAPSLECPVLDCWAGIGDGPAAALDEALNQWVHGTYWAYHDALAHPHEPTYVLEGQAEWAVFEGPLLSRGGEEDALDRIAAAGPTRAVLSGVLADLSPGTTHRIRWVYSATSREIFIDDEPRSDLLDALAGVAWPDPLPLLVKQAALLRAPGPPPVHESFGDLKGIASSVRSRALGPASEVRGELSQLQHAIELEPRSPELPALLLRATRLFPELTRARGEIGRPMDAPLSRSFLEAYRLMRSGHTSDAVHWLKSAIERASGDGGEFDSHVLALSSYAFEQALPQRTDAIINVLRQAAAEGIAGGGSVTRVASSSIEAPSAVASAQGVFPNIEISWGDAGEWDPRRPSDGSATCLWTYERDGFFARFSGLAKIGKPALPAPEASVREAVAGLARQPFDREQWSRQAKEIALELGTQARSGVLATMVHGGEGVRDTAWDARFAMMCAAALIVSHMPSDAEAGPDPVQILCSILDGPVDWTTTAAAFALTDLALRFPEARPGVVEQLVARLNRPVIPVWYQSYVEPVIWLLLRLPDVDDSVRSLALGAIRAS